MNELEKQLDSALTNNKFVCKLVSFVVVLFPSWFTSKNQQPLPFILLSVGVAGKGSEIVGPGSNTS
jgi:hypothetical protein